MSEYRAASGSSAEDLFIELFTDTFGAEKAGYLYSQFHFYDIYQNDRFADFFLESGARKIAIEIDDEASHNKLHISQNKFYDDLLKQNSMVHLGWDVFRWAVKQLQIQPDTVKDELRVFVGSDTMFREVENYLPVQRGKALQGFDLELKEHQKQALDCLETMRSNHETIALLYHATGTGKTVTAVSDAKRMGGRTLFLAHTVELVEQAANTFRELWKSVNVGKYVDTIKQPNAHVVCGSIQSVALNLDRFKDDDFDYLIIDEAHHASADTYQKVLAYFKPKFTLGLTATPERADDKNILDIFKNTAHKLDIQTAVEIGELVPVRCIRIHTNVDLTKVLYTQQLGRGMRLADGKESLIVFDFVDNASQYNMPYSMHRLFQLKDYKPGKLVLGTKQQRAADDQLYAKGEKPDAIIDFPIDATDYEAVDVFNWQEEAAGMISQMEFIRRVDVQSETVERYIREGKIIPDLIVPMSEHRTFKYFKEETLETAAKQYGWQLINDDNRKDMFMEMIRQMDMSYSYKPVLIKAVLTHADSKGRVKLDDIVAYFRSYYEGRRNAGLTVEKPNSIFAKGGYTEKDAQRNILSNPFKRFQDMQMLRHTKTLGIIEVEPTVWRNLTEEEKAEILEICEEKLERYYKRFEN